MSPRSLRILRGLRLRRAQRRNSRLGLVDCHPSAYASDAKELPRLALALRNAPANRLGRRANGRDWARTALALIFFVVNGVRSVMSRGHVVVARGSHGRSVRKKCRSRTSEIPSARDPRLEVIDHVPEAV